MWTWQFTFSACIETLQVLPLNPFSCLCWCESNDGDTSHRTSWFLGLTSWKYIGVSWKLNSTWLTALRETVNWAVNESQLFSFYVYSCILFTICTRLFLKAALMLFSFVLIWMRYDNFVSYANLCIHTYVWTFWPAFDRCLNCVGVINICFPVKQLYVCINLNEFLLSLSL